MPNTDIEKIIHHTIMALESIKTDWNDSVQKTFYEEHVSNLIIVLKKIKDDNQSIHSEFIRLKHKLQYLQEEFVSVKTTV